jgi:hypothetical protein
MQVSNNGKSFSLPGAVPFTVIVTDFTVSASQTSQVAYAGVPTVFSVAVSSTSYGAFSNPVSLSCSAGLPTGATCSFSPASVIPGASIATSVLTVYSSGLALTNTHPAKLGTMVPLEGAAFVAVIFVPLFSFKRGAKGSKAIIRMLLVILPAIAIVSINGCSSSNQLIHTTPISLTLQSLQ